MHRLLSPNCNSRDGTSRDTVVGRRAGGLRNQVKELMDESSNWDLMMNDGESIEECVC